MDVSPPQFRRLREDRRDLDGCRLRTIRARLDQRALHQKVGGSEEGRQHQGHQRGKQERQLKAKGSADPEEGARRERG